MKPRFKSQANAEKRVRELERQLNEWRQIAERFDVERKMLAKLAAKGPTFFNPLEAFAAEDVRDKLLAKMGMKPDGTFLTEGR